MRFMLSSPRNHREFARLGGKGGGVVANQPESLAGALDIELGQRCSICWFCDAFNIPLVVFEDVPGFLPGIAQEHGGIIRMVPSFYTPCGSNCTQTDSHHSKAYGGA
ncbi:MAG: hypothetical protein Ct9H300mP15_19510 [Gemmatimonadota bacterium]|nr:MAG: hypothetical protein Ct9H300mP15_19510 [Gemmatimonadota bacterium]